MSDWFRGGLLRRTSDATYRKGLYLTAKGRGFYPILIAIQSWADGWIHHRVRSFVKLRHAPCQKVLQPLLICAGCGFQVTRDCGRLLLGSGATTLVASCTIHDTVRAESARTCADEAREKPTLEFTSQTNTLILTTHP